MKISVGGYKNPMQGLQRRMAPDFASREFRDPGLSRMRSSSGLGSLRHTMPHLKPAVRKMQAGGSLMNPMGQLYAASRPNLYNPDPMERRILEAARQMAGQYSNPAMRAMPGSSAIFPYAAGGEAEDPPMPAHGEPGLEELMEGDEDLAPKEQQQKQVVIEAMLALEGRHPDPRRALEAFVQEFGQDALGELQQMMRQREDQEPEEEEDQEPEPEEEDLAAAGGGLLSGPGSGQSDEIEGTTPSGHPVLLSDGEYVIDAPTVAALGDGSTHAGARRLDELRKKIRSDAYGHDKQAKPMKNGGRSILVEFGG